MTERLITAPTFEPLSLAEAKLHLRVDGTDEDALIGDLIKAAREECEQETGRALVRQTWEATFDAFDSALRLTRAPFLAVVSLNYVDTNQATQALAANAYAIDSSSCPTWLKPAYGTEWPDTLDAMNSVIVRYRAGYLDTGSGVGGVPTEAEAQAAVPAALRQWIRIRVATLYDQARSSVIIGTSAMELPGRAVSGLLDRFRTYVE